MKQLLGLIRYRQKRVVRNFIFPAVFLLPLVLGVMLCRGYVVYGSGISLISSAQGYLPVLGLLLLLAAATLAGREEDEGSDVFLLVAPLSSPVIFFVKILSLCPLAAAVFLGLFIPVMVELSIAWWRVGYDFSLVLAETGIFLLWLLPSLFFATVLGGVLGIMKRGLHLYLLVLFTWGVLVIAVEALPPYGWPASPCSFLWPLLKWYGGLGFMQMGIGLRFPPDFWSFLPGLPVWVWQRSFYIAVTIAVMFCAARIFRHSRRGYKESSFFLSAAVVSSLVLVLILGTGFYFAREPIKASARAEVEHYINFAREHPEHFQIAFENQFVRINSYDLYLDISEPPLLAVRALIVVENFGAEEVSPLHLILRHHFRISEAQVGDTLLSVEQVGDRVIFPETALSPGESIEMTLEYTGRVEEWRLLRHDLTTYLKCFVKDYGLYLPPTYGWYPLSSALPLEVAHELTCPPHLRAWHHTDYLGAIPLSLGGSYFASQRYTEHIVSMLPVVREDQKEKIVLDEWDVPPELVSRFEEELRREGIKDEERKEIIKEKIKERIMREKIWLQQRETIVGLLPWHEETFFRVTVEPLSHYTLVSNLAEKRYIQNTEAGTGTKERARAGSAVLFEGYAPHLFLIGWPFERTVLDGGVVYAPAGTAMLEATELIEIIQCIREWFGALREEVKLVSFPMHVAREQIITSSGKFYVDNPLWFSGGYFGGEQVMIRIAADLLCGGVRMPTRAETRLIEAFIETKRRRYQDEGQQVPPPFYMPWNPGNIDFDRLMPQAAAIADWLEENEGAAENPVHALFLLSRERPLQEEDLAVFGH